MNISTPLSSLPPATALVTTLTLALLLSPAAAQADKKDSAGYHRAAHAQTQQATRTGKPHAAAPRWHGKPRHRHDNRRDHHQPHPVRPHSRPRHESVIVHNGHHRPHHRHPHRLNLLLGLHHGGFGLFLHD